MNIKNVKENIVKFFKETRIEVLNIILSSLGMAIFILFALIRSLFRNLSSDFALIGILLSCLILSSIGLLLVYRKEAPGIMQPIKGTLAVIRGVFLFSMFFIAFVVILVLRFVFLIRLE